MQKQRETGKLEKKQLLLSLPPCFFSFQIYIIIMYIDMYIYVIDCLISVEQ